MAQDLFIIPLDEPSPQHFDRRLVADILREGAVEPDVDFSCTYVDGSEGEAHVIEDDPARNRIDHLGFVHFGGRMMMERIYRLAEVLEVCLMWSGTCEGEPVGCVTRVDRLDRIPLEMRPLGFEVARDASHLNLLVKDSTFEENGW